jgi:hypothetical protein
MKREITEEEWDLIESIRSFKNSKHNPSEEMEWVIKEMFENLLYD